MRRIIDDEKREHEVGSEVKSGIVTLFGEKKWSNMKSILELSEVKARKYFMESTNYCSLDLPKYIDFSDSNCHNDYYFNVKDFVVSKSLVLA